MNDKKSEDIEIIMERINQLEENQMSLGKEIAELKEQHDLDIYTLLQAINGWAKNHINLEKNLLGKMEINGGK